MIHRNEKRENAMTHRTGRRFPSPHRRTRRAALLLRLAAAALLTLAFSAAGTGVAGAATGVQWSVVSTANTAATPGQTLTYYVHIANVGDTSTDGSAITFTATLPTFVTAASASGSGWSCSAVAGASTFQCTNTSVIAPRKGPASFPSLQVRVNVDPLATGTQSARFTVAGGDPANPSTTIVDPVVISGGTLPFGVDAFDGQVSDANDAAFTQGGGHPYSIATEIDFNRITNANPVVSSPSPVEPVKDVVVDLPPGLVGNPTATGGLKCSAEQLANTNLVTEEPTCPPGSQVGTATTTVNLGAGGGDDILGPVSLFNMVPPPGVPARFGFNVAGAVVTLNAALRSDSDYGLTIDVAKIPEALPVVGTSLTFWGVPADPSHDPQRSCPGQIEPYLGGPSCTTDAPVVPFLRNPTSCQPNPGSGVTDGLVTSLHVDSWDNPGRLLSTGLPDLSDPNWKSATFVTHVPPGYPASPNDPSTPWGAHQLPTGCDKVPFDPTLDAAPSGPAVANAPSGYTFDLKLPQNQIPDGIGEGDLKAARVTLPAGVRVSPSAADGLGACTQAQVGLHSTADPTCPDSSKVGRVTITTPLLDDPMTGSIYLAKPGENPFGTLLSIYLVAKGPGLIVKLAGKVEANSATGQLTTTFNDNPQLPFSDLNLQFDGGARSPLANPVGCGTYTTDAVLTSWSGATVDSKSAFTVSGDGHGAPCQSGFAPAFGAGTANPVAAAYSPFLLRVSRQDSEQRLGSIEAALPEGVLGKLAGVPYCSEASIAQARARGNEGEGALELAQPSCPAASQVGSALVGAGPGSSPFYVRGKVYLAGPYKGAPLSLAIVTPVLAGPFDLGTVVVRAALRVDPETAQITAVSDPLPTILHGIPLDLRDVRVEMNRPSFTLNPTSCAPTEVASIISSAVGGTAHPASRFQVGDCGALPFKPRLRLQLKGATRRSGHPALKAVVTYPKQGTYANIARAQVGLPHSEFLDQGNLNKVCKQADLRAGTCPTSSIYGHAKAWTPLLDKPLEGPVYLGVGFGYKLPALVADLNGQIRILLVGKVDTTKKKGIRNTFEVVPDAPVSRFVLEMKGGKKYGLLENSENTCRRKQQASALFTAHNGDRLHLQPRIANGCGKHRKGGGKKKS